MTAIIINTLAGLVPTTAEDLKNSMDHCEHIIADCNDTIQNPECFQHDRDEHIKLLAQAKQALNLLKKVKL